MGDSEILIFIGLMSLIVIAFMIMVVALVFQYRRKKQVYDHNQQLAQELHRLELLNNRTEVQSETMLHIGREIHDSVAQKLTLVSLQIQRTEHENANNPIGETLHQSNQLINETLDELRLLSRRLIRQSDEQMDMIPLLQSECNRVSQMRFCAVHFESDSPEKTLPAEVAQTILRMLQELLQNSLKYADCKNIYVKVMSRQQTFRLEVADDGKGFDWPAVEQSPGVGIKNIRKRSALIGAEIDYDSMPGTGTRFTLTLPY